MVVVCATLPRPVDFKLSCAHCLESTLRHCHVEPHKPSGMRHVFPRPRSRPHQHHAPMSSSLKITAVFYSNQHPRRTIKLSSLIQPNLSDCNHAPPCVIFVPHIFVHSLTPYVCM